MYSYVFDARVPSKGEKTRFVFIRKSSEKVSKAFESRKYGKYTTKKWSVLQIYAVWQIYICINLNQV